MSYTTIERSSRIYNTVADIFTYIKNSECLTPIELVRQQVDNVKPTDKVCIPGAGIGTYVMVLIEKGVEPGNITAVELDSRYYELGSLMFERFGVNYVNADFLTWQPEMQFDVIVGNPPYTDTSRVKGATLGGCSKGLDNVFFERCLGLSKRVSLIIRSKHFAKKSSTFRRRLFSCGHLSEIVAVPLSTFPSISLTETCVVTYDESHTGACKVTFQDGSERLIDLDKNTCIKLTNPDYAPEVGRNLAPRYQRGNLNLNQLNDGDYPMIITMGGRDKDMVVRLVDASQCVCGVNQHGVVLNSKYGGKGLGKVYVKPFEYAVSGSAIILKTDSEEESIQLQKYLSTPEIQQHVVDSRASNANTKDLFKTIVDPLVR